MNSATETFTTADEWILSPHTREIIITRGYQFNEGQRIENNAKREPVIIQVTEATKISKLVHGASGNLGKIEIISNRKTPDIAKEILPESKTLYREKVSQIPPSDCVFQSIPASVK